MLPRQLHMNDSLGTHLPAASHRAPDGHAVDTGDNSHCLQSIAYIFSLTRGWIGNAYMNI